MTYLTEILIKLTRAIARSGVPLDMVRSNYTVDGIEITIVDNETKQIALLRMTPIPEPEKQWTDYAPDDHDCGKEQGCPVCKDVAIMDKTAYCPVCKMEVKVIVVNDYVDNKEGRCECGYLLIEY